MAQRPHKIDYPGLHTKDGAKIRSMSVINRGRMSLNTELHPRDLVWQEIIQGVLAAIDDIEEGSNEQA